MHCWCSYTAQFSSAMFRYQQALLMNPQIICYLSTDHVHSESLVSKRWPCIIRVWYRSTDHVLLEFGIEALTMYHQSLVSKHWPWIIRVWYRSTDHVPLECVIEVFAYVFSEFGDHVYSEGYRRAGHRVLEAPTLWYYCINTTPWWLQVYC